MRADQNGQTNYSPSVFLRKTMSEHARTFKAEARKSFERDAERIALARPG